MNQRQRPKTNDKGSIYKHFYFWYNIILNKFTVLLAQNNKKFYNLGYSNNNIKTAHIWILGLHLKIKFLKRLHNCIHITTYKIKYYKF